MVAFWWGAGRALLSVSSQPPAPKATMPVAVNDTSAQRFGFPGAPCRRDTKRGLPHPMLALVHQLRGGPVTPSSHVRIMDAEELWELMAKGQRPSRPLRGSQAAARLWDLRPSSLPRGWSCPAGPQTHLALPGRPRLPLSRVQCVIVHQPMGRGDQEEITQPVSCFQTGELRETAAAPRRAEGGDGTRPPPQVRSVLSPKLRGPLPPCGQSPTLV